MRSVAYSPDGTHIVSGSDDKSVRIWEIQPIKHLICAEVLEKVRIWEIQPIKHLICAEVLEKLEEMSKSINPINVDDMVSLFAFIIEYSHELEDDEKLDFRMNIIPICRKIKENNLDGRDTWIKSIARRFGEVLKALK